MHLSTSLCTHMLHTTILDGRTPGQPAPTHYSHPREDASDNQEDRILGNHNLVALVEFSEAGGDLRGREGLRLQSRLQIALAHHVAPRSLVGLRHAERELHEALLGEEHRRDLGTAAAAAAAVLLWICDRRLGGGATACIIAQGTNAELRLRISLQRLPSQDLAQEHRHLPVQVWETLWATQARLCWLTP